MERRRSNFPPCEAPEHSEGCNGRGATKDHFQPKSIQKLWKIKNTEDNIQRLSWECHQSKDRDTGLRGQILKRQLKGKIFSFEEHREIFKSK